MPDFPKIPNIGALLRKNFLAGLFVVIPLAVIAWILAEVLSTLWSLEQFLPLTWQPAHYFRHVSTVRFLNFLITLGVTLALSFAISFLGWASKQFLGQKFLEMLAHLIQRIPVVRSIYSALDQLLKTMASGGGQQFNRVVYIEYPRKGVWALAFVTSTARGNGIGPGHLNVYVPTTPNPTSGFHLIIDEAEVRESHLTVEEAFKTILSLGIAQPAGLPNG